MSAAARLQLKRPNGWFAAGQEVQQAATSLSDAAFKVFIWICLHAERASGRLLVTVTALAQALRKSEAEIIGSLEELVRTGTCRWFEGGMEIQDRFWPYEGAPSRQDSGDASAYVAAIKRIFLSLGCVQSAFTPADEELAHIWHPRGVTPEVAERAILLGGVRKYVALINNGAGTPITTLHYFKELVEEASQPDVRQCTGTASGANFRRSNFAGGTSAPNRGPPPERKRNNIDAIPQISRPVTTRCTNLLDSCRSISQHGTAQRNDASILIDIRSE